MRQLIYVEVSILPKNGVLKIVIEFKKLNLGFLYFNHSFLHERNIEGQNFELYM